MDKPVMTPEQMTRELNYRAALTVAEKLKREGVLSPGDFRRIEQKLRRKFSPVWGAIDAES